MLSKKKCDLLRFSAGHRPRRSPPPPKLGLARVEKCDLYCCCASAILYYCSPTCPFRNRVRLSPAARHPPVQTPAINTYLSLSHTHTNQHPFSSGSCASGDWRKLNTDGGCVTLLDSSSASYSSTAVVHTTPQTITCFFFCISIFSIIFPVVSWGLGLLHPGKLGSSNPAPRAPTSFLKSIR